MQTVKITILWYWSKCIPSAAVAVSQITRQDNPEVLERYNQFSNTEQYLFTSPMWQVRDETLKCQGVVNSMYDPPRSVWV
jgi:hypothetical protein